MKHRTHTLPHKWDLFVRMRMQSDRQAFKDPCHFVSVVVILVVVVVMVLVFLNSIIHPHTYTHIRKLLTNYICTYYMLLSWSSVHGALSEITSQCDRLSKCKTTLHDGHDGITIKEIKFRPLPDVNWHWDRCGAVVRKWRLCMNLTKE